MAVTLIACSVVFYIFISKFYIEREQHDRNKISKVTVSDFHTSSMVKQIDSSNSFKLSEEI